jgi:hydrogenase maturation protease
MMPPGNSWTKSAGTSQGAAPPWEDAASGPLWIVGYGNPQRRDDGLGPYVISLVEERLEGRPGIRTLGAHQLVPELCEDLKDAGQILLIDAALEENSRGWRWRNVEPELSGWPSLSHGVSPGVLLGLLQSFYEKSPPTWLISIQGKDFDFGEELSPEAEERARKVAEEIMMFVNGEWRPGESDEEIDSDTSSPTPEK